MATRGMIGVVLPSGQVRAVYCHYDSYPEYLGVILDEFYHDMDLVESLCTYPIQSISESGFPNYFEDDGSDETFHVYNSMEEYFFHFGSEGDEYRYVLTEDGWVSYDGVQPTYLDEVLYRD